MYQRIYESTLAIIYYTCSSATGLVCFFISPFPEITNLSTKYFKLSMVYTDTDGMKYLYHGLSSCTGDKSTRRLSYIISSYRRTNHDRTVTVMLSVPKVIKLFPCSTQLSMKFQMLIILSTSRNSAFFWFR